MRERQLGKTQEQAAAKANLRSRKTVARYEQLGAYPSELKRLRQYRTREDVFAADWPEVEAMLQAAPELEAKALFEWLCEAKQGVYEPGQLRTFQRRVERWRALALQGGQRRGAGSQTRHFHDIPSPNPVLQWQL